MAKANKPKFNVGGALGKAAGIAGIVNAATPIVVKLIDRIPTKDNEEVEPSEELIFMPDLCSKKFPLNKDEAKELLENRGLKILLTEVRLREACAKYKDCFEFQVVGTDRKPNSKVKIGDTVIVQYVTQEVINESRLIFEKVEREKADAKQAKIERRAAQMEKIKTGTAKTMHKAAEAIGDGTVAVKDGVKKLITRDREKNKEKENFDE